MSVKSLTMSHGTSSITEVETCMSYGKGDREVMDKLCGEQGWPQVPFLADVSIFAISDGTWGIHAVRGTVESVFRDYKRDSDGRTKGSLTTFAQVRLETPLPGVKRNGLIEVTRVHHPEVHPVGPLDLMAEAINKE